MDTAAERLLALTRTIPDFPSPGVLFRDLTPVLADPEGLRLACEELVAPFLGGFDVIAGVEARGFAFGAAAAAFSGTGVLLVRKAGKLPGETLGETYELEYGSAAIEVHVDQLPAGTRVLVVDDVLATGGTLGATAALVERAGWRVAGLSVVMELAALGGRARLGRDVHAVIVE